MSPINYVELIHGLATKAHDEIEAGELAANDERIVFALDRIALALDRIVSKLDRARDEP